MKILFLTSGRRVPSSRFRVVQYVPYLRRLGHHCVLAHSHPPKYEHYRLLGWRLSQWLQRALRRIDCLRARLQRFDVVLLERELFNSASYELEMALRSSTRTLLLDMDDGVFLSHPHKFRRLAEICDGVIAGNEAIRQHMSQFNRYVNVIPTAVDLSRYTPGGEPRDAGRPPLIGWTGTAANLANLKILEGPLRRLAARRHFRFRLIAEASARVSDLNLDGLDWELRAWSAAREIRDLQQLDIGVMPLADNPWNRCKCGLKIIQYLAVGKPAVASPVGVNREIIREGQTGLLAADAEQWQSQLQQLIDDAQSCRRMGAAGREWIRQRYSVEANLPKLLDVFEKAVARTRH